MYRIRILWQWPRSNLPAQWGRLFVLLIISSTLAISSKLVCSKPSWRSTQQYSISNYLNVITFLTKKQYSITYVTWNLKPKKVCEWWWVMRSCCFIMNAKSRSDTTVPTFHSGIICATSYLNVQLHNSNAILGFQIIWTVVMLIPAHSPSSPVYRIDYTCKTSMLRVTSLQE